MKIKAAVVRKGTGIRIEEINVAQPKVREVLVKTKYCGYCHTNFSIVEGEFGFPHPFVLGHEASGIVVDVGPGVTQIKKGDHVVACWAAACGKCKLCLSGQGYLCSTTRGFLDKGTLLDGTSRLSDANGDTLCHETLVSGFAEYMVIPIESAIKVPQELPLDQAALLACSVPTGYGSTINPVHVKQGDSVAVWGVGGIGLNVIQGAKLAGANPIIAVDIEGCKEEIARLFGATHFINNSKKDPIPIIKDLTNGGVDYAFEASGDTGAIEQIYWSLAEGGKQVQIGLHCLKKIPSIPLIFTPLHSKNIIGSLYGHVNIHTDIQAIADMILSGKYIDLDCLITNRFKLDEIKDVHSAMGEHKIIGRWLCEF
jgi:S-(hydroxymethyl)glutathione dehydrogenase / alcohol dehydrogenase